MTDHFSLLFIAIIALGIVAGAAAFRWVPTSWAVLGVLLGGFLLLPPARGWTIWGHFAFDKRMAASLAILIGVALFRREVFARWRPRWLDAPMLLFVTWPLISWIAHRGLNPDIMAAQVWRQIVWWWGPYWIGRAVFTRPDDASRVLRAVLLAGVAYAPLAWYESLSGLDQFLMHRIFGYDMPSNAARLGGIRPSVFLSGGLELCFFYALVAVSGLWLVRHPVATRTRRWHAAPLSLAAVISLIGFRGVGGYSVAAYSLPALVSRRPRVLVVVLALLLAAPGLYIGTRTAGWVTAQTARQLGRPLGPRAAGSFGARVGQEAAHLEEVRAAHPVVGFGPTHYYYWADGRWVQVLREFGLGGLGVWWLAFCGVPGAVCLARGWRCTPAQAALWLPQAGLLLLVCVYGADTLINHPLTPMVAFLPGVLLSQRLDPGEAAPSPADRSP